MIADAKQQIALDSKVGRRLDSLAAKLRQFIFVYGIAIVLAVFVGACTIQFSLDYWLHGIRVSVRAAMLGALLIGVVWFARKYILLPLRAPMGRTDMANLVERHYPQLSSSLISAVRFSLGHVGAEESNSREMVRAVVAGADRRTADLDFNVVLDSTRVRHGGMILLTLVIFVGAVGVFSPELIRVGAARNLLLQNVDWPRQTRLIVESSDGEIIAARGDDVVIEARAEGVQPRSVEIFYRTESGIDAREPMFTVGSAGDYRYRFTLKSAEEDFTFFLEGGDDRTNEFNVKLLDRPKVVSSQIAVTPPAYANLESFSLGVDERATQVLPGSQVTITAQLNKAVDSANLMAGADDVAVATPDGNSVGVTFTAMKSHTYHLSMVDAIGLENRRPVRFSIRVIKDEPPRVRLALTDVGDMITPEAIIPIEISFQDRYGVAAGELMYQVLREGESRNEVYLPGFEPGTKNYLSRINWAVAEAAVVPGDRLAIQASAVDFDDVLGPNQAQSAEFTLRVVTSDELLAELAKREREYRQAFERLVDEQEQVRGRLLSVRSEVADTESGLRSQLAVLERRQRNITASVNVIRQQFQQILAQLTINNLDSRDERERLESSIIDPLNELVRRDLLEAADAIRIWSREGTADSGVQADKIQVTVLKKMRSVLSNMIQWEGYHEVVTMLRDIIRLQRELGDEAEESVLKEADDVFDD